MSPSLSCSRALPPAARRCVASSVSHPRALFGVCPPPLCLRGARLFSSRDAPSSPPTYPRPALPLPLGIFFFSSGARRIMAAPALPPPPLTCVVCLTAPPTLTLWPCGHTPLCPACAVSLPPPPRCPLCRTPVAGAAAAPDGAPVDLAAAIASRAAVDVATWGAVLQVALVGGRGVGKGGVLRALCRAFPLPVGRGGGLPRGAAAPEGSGRGAGGGGGGGGRRMVGMGGGMPVPRAGRGGQGVEGQGEGLGGRDGRQVGFSGGVAGHGGAPAEREGEGGAWPPGGGRAAALGGGGGGGSGRWLGLWVARPSVYAANASVRGRLVRFYVVPLGEATVRLGEGRRGWLRLACAPPRRWCGGRECGRCLWRLVAGATWLVECLAPFRYEQGWAQPRGGMIG